ncbi:MAG: YbhN family protein [Candidatus Hermodarchaeota archaeon]
MSEITQETPTLKEFFDPKTIFFITIALIIMLIYFALSTQEQGGLSSIIDALLQASIPFVVGAIIISFSVFGIDILIWRTILSTIGIRPNLTQITNVYLTSLVFGILFPSGGTVEIGVRTAMGREFYNHFEGRNASAGEILSSIALHRLIGTLAFLPFSVIAAIGLAILLEGYLPPYVGLFLVVTMATLACFLAIIIFSTYFMPDQIIRLVSALPIISNYKAAIEVFVHDYNSSLSHLMKYKVKTVLIFFCAIGTAFISYLGGTLIVYSIDSDISFFVAIFIIFLTGMLLMIPIPLPGMTGIKESVLAFLFNIYKPGQPEKSAAISILIGFTSFYLTVILGLSLYIVTRYFSFKKKKQKTVLSLEKTGEE